MKWLLHPNIHIETRKKIHECINKYLQNDTCWTLQYKGSNKGCDIELFPQNFKNIGAKNCNKCNSC